MGLLGDYAEPLQGMTILISIPRASLRCALGARGRTLPSAVSQARLSAQEANHHLRRTCRSRGGAIAASRASGWFSLPFVFCANGAPHTSLGHLPQVICTLWTLP